MIDLHCHLLPGIDDGARDLEQALVLARASVADGITHCVATPHIHTGRFPNTLSSITKAFNQLREALAEEGIPLQLGMSAEIRLSEEILNMVLLKQVPYLGDWEDERVLLLELPHSHIPPGTEQLIRWLRKQKVRPMIAHPERNKDVMRDFNKVLPLVREGCLFQVTAGAVAGHFGEPAQERAIQLLEQDLVTILATDAHHEVRRPPVLNTGRLAAEEIVGEEKAWQLVRENPGKIAACHFS
ncbi:tyrosine-protein phosphatase [Microbulbifer pacificus]|uniref:protein-tyrosine-phosphatase n=1 Tax=Microbulbifer pacificus TaxID=407164 RepID=A0AAU0MZI4_9GAMM|nr:CpsB/CapC family capsule biosynthesis tyrosine phosphatase [Microbulbifer pacificus]WOX04849.1 CpsB/CapC family capsule biosynthesis tyrosine phosphatase [Microbulbifer pacificus]